MRRITQCLVSTATIESLRGRVGTMSSMLAAPVHTVEVAWRTSCGGGHGSIGHGGTRVKLRRRTMRRTEITSAALLRASSPGPLVGTAHATRGGELAKHAS
ncbi:hypothetical protein SETIT_2G174700v2 [Setaria italica]|uniref:Uncharacterized protein n=1 Tax=Setaria italica TaxID=4555 RepID=A0A368PZT2_SETIT|nr:hypothetical protein SETIT_2G174700v2 [Setaria italica]